MKSLICQSMQLGVLRLLIGLLFVTPCGFPAADAQSTTKPQDPQDVDQKPLKELILPGEAFLLDDHPAFIYWPDDALRNKPQPWVFYAPTLPGFPDSHEKWMHERFLEAGIAVAGIDVGEAYGSPESRAVFDRFYQQVTADYGLAMKPCLLGRSRGGLWVSAWACDHAERFAGLAGIYPVFDFRTYPGLAAAAPAYQLSVADLEGKLDILNPIRRMPVLARVGLPTFIIHGELDTVVPLKENSAAFAQAYQDAGNGEAVHVIVAEGQGHNYWEGFFRCQPLIDFVIERARAGAAATSSNDAAPSPGKNE